LRYEKKGKQFGGKALKSLKRREGLKNSHASNLKSDKTKGEKILKGTCKTSKN